MKEYASDKIRNVAVLSHDGAGTVVDKTVEKVWVNGPKPTVTIELWRKNNVNGADKIDEKVGEFQVPANASGNDLKKTFTKLAKHDSKGHEFEYYVKEDNVPANYTKKIEGLKVTNTYDAPKINVEATKIWVGGPAADHTQVELLLKRKSAAPGAVEQVVNKEPIKSGNGEGPFFYKWENVEQKDDNGYDYTYSVEEENITPEGTVIVHGRTYKVTQQENAGKHIITNSYDAGTKFIATKTWVGGPAGDHTKVTLVLQQSVGGAAAGPVPGNPQPTVTGVGEGPFTYTWENLPTEQGGQAISYSVKEQGEAGGTVTINGRDYTVSYNGSNVVNSYGQNSTKFIATKTWAGTACCSCSTKATDP